jgi:hypothetical protein
MQKSKIGEKKSRKVKDPKKKWRERQPVPKNPGLKL